MQRLTILAGALLSLMAYPAIAQVHMRTVIAMRHLADTPSVEPRPDKGCMVHGFVLADDNTTPVQKAAVYAHSFGNPKVSIGVTNRRGSYNVYVENNEKPAFTRIRLPDGRWRAGPRVVCPLA